MSHDPDAARILVDLGAPAHEAVRQVRAARAGAIETRSQLEHVMGPAVGGAGASA